MKKIFLVAVLFLAWKGMDAMAGVKLTRLTWSQNDSVATLMMAHQGQMNDAPEWKIDGRAMKVIIPDSTIIANVNKAQGPIRLVAHNIDKDVVITATFPHDISSERERISVTLKNGVIEMTTPKAKAVTASNAAAPMATKPVEVKAIAKASDGVSSNVRETLDEDYLRRLEAEEAKKEAPVIKPQAASSVVTEKTTKPKSFLEDEVKTAQAQSKTPIEGFSMVGYAGKFIAFLGVVLLLFWGVVQLMKKGVLSKGKLGFLNGGQLVTVLSTTYVSPKKSLLVVKAHNQVFLVANHEGGMEFISELKDFAGIVKEGEKTVTGENFDTNLGQVNETEAETKVVLKENIHESKPLSTAAERAAISKDIVRFSEELKKKVKNLKPLQ